MASPIYKVVRAKRCGDRFVRMLDETNQKTRAVSACGFFRALFAESSNYRKSFGTRGLLASIPTDPAGLPRPALAARVAATMRAIGEKALGPLPTAFDLALNVTAAPGAARPDAFVCAAAARCRVPCTDPCADETLVILPERETTDAEPPGKRVRSMSCISDLVRTPREGLRKTRLEMSGQSI